MAGRTHRLASSSRKVPQRGRLTAGHGARLSGRAAPRTLGGLRMRALRARRSPGRGADWSRTCRSRSDRSSRVPPTLAESAGLDLGPSRTARSRSRCRQFLDLGLPLTRPPGPSGPVVVEARVEVDPQALPRCSTARGSYQPGRRLTVQGLVARVWPSADREVLADHEALHIATPRDDPADPAVPGRRPRSPTAAPVHDHRKRSRSHVGQIDAQQDRAPSLPARAYRRPHRRWLDELPLDRRGAAQRTAEWTRYEFGCPAPGRLQPHLDRCRPGRRWPARPRRSRSAGRTLKYGASASRWRRGGHRPDPGPGHHLDHPFPGARSSRPRRTSQPTSPPGSAFRRRASRLNASTGVDGSDRPVCVPGCAADCWRFR